MNNDTLVDIVLASYNGELYIKEQINSILEQTHKNIRLIVSDDGSSDNTQNVVKKIMEKDSR
ncbi:TPA: glycosyltransferase, partial [Klebsiella pneumoniae]|nr:glycosyltransferase [Klebsiella pneumoniae]